MFFDLEAPIRVTGFGRITQSKGFWHDDWSRREYLLLYLLDGDLDLKAGDAEYELKSGDTVIVPPCTSYRPLQSNGCVYYHFYFKAEECDPYKSEFSIKNSHCRGLPNFSYSFYSANRTVIEVQNLTKHTDKSRLGKILNRCAELDLWQRPNEKMLLDNYLKEILIQLSLMHAPAGDTDTSFERMATFIERHYHRDISLFEVAEAAHLSSSYAAKLFRKNAKMRCCDYINKVRLAAACELLVNTNTKIGEIAERVGYKSQYYFARQFKKTYGVTALEFRKTPNGPSF